MTEVFQFEIPDQEEFELIQPKTEHLLSNLAQDKLSKISNPLTYRQTFLADLLTRILIRSRLNCNFQDIVFDSGVKDKPSLMGNNLYFNYSHSANQIAIVLSDKECGIDIEKIQSNRIKVADRFFSEEEKTFIHNSKNKDYSFTIFWTIKEAYLKYIGTGLTRALKSFTVEPKEEIQIYEQGSLLECKIKLFQNDPEFLIAVCAEEEISDNLKCLSITNLLKDL